MVSDYTGNLDELSQNGIFNIGSSGVTNGPEGMTNYSLLTNMVYGTNGVQQVYTRSTNTSWIRSKTSSGWQPWQRLDNFGYNSLAELSAGVAKEADLMSYKGSFTLNEEDGHKETGWLSNWTSGVIGGTFLEVLNSGSFILQRETNPYVGDYCRIRMSTNGGSTWSDWKKVSSL